MVSLDLHLVYTPFHGIMRIFGGIMAWIEEVVKVKLS